VEVAARCSGRPEGRHVERRAGMGARVRHGGAFGGRVGCRCARGSCRHGSQASVADGVFGYAARSLADLGTAHGCTRAWALIGLSSYIGWA
jgi:hypothetical protein